MYITLGHWPSLEKPNSTLTTIVTTETLQIGQEWVVFDLENRRYWGKAKVISSNYSLCNISKGGILTTKLNPQAQGLVVLVRPITNNLSKAKIKRVKYSDLPINFRKNNPGGDRFFIYYTLDINSNNLVDIIVADEILEPIAYVYMSVAKEWKDAGHWYPAC